VPLAKSTSQQLAILAFNQISWITETKVVSAKLDTSWIATNAELVQLDAINALTTEEFNTSKFAKESQLPQQEQLQEQSSE